MRRLVLVGTALVAVLALSAGADAASRWVISNVNQIKPSVRAQLRGHSGPQGPQGVQGVQGLQGSAGPAGASGAQTVSQASGARATLCDNDTLTCSVGSSIATCPPGTVVVGGGWDGTPSPPVNATAAFNRPVGTGGWEVVMADDSNTQVGFTQTFSAVATCIGGGIRPALARSAHVAIDLVARDLAAVRAQRVK